jgi:hypothetical protein
MGRRDCIGVLTSAAAWPLAPRVPLLSTLRRVSVLTGSRADDPEFRKWFAGPLDELGSYQGNNLRVELRPARGDLTTLWGYASELVGLNPDVVLASEPRRQRLSINQRKTFQLCL